MITYYIYEIDGTKAGATKEPHIRDEYNFDRYQIEPKLLETMEGADDEAMWQIVGDREWQWADELGYERGTHYRVMRLMALKGGASRSQQESFKDINSYISSESKGKAGRLGGATTRDSGDLLIAAKLGGKATRTTTFEIAQEIRSKYIPKKYTYGMIAEEYGVSVYTVINIVKRRSYLEP